MLWNVYTFNINKRQFESYNVFSHAGFKKDINELLTNGQINRTDFSKKLEDILRYYFWSRCEWEMIVSEWPPAPADKNVEVKVDVYDQIKLNWENFVQYCWSYRNVE